MHAMHESSDVPLTNRIPWLPGGWLSLYRAVTVKMVVVVIVIMCCCKVSNNMWDKLFEMI